MNNALARVLKFPTKATRRAYKRRLYSKTTVINVFEISVGVLIGDRLCKMADWFFQLIF